MGAYDVSPIFLDRLSGPHVRLADTRQLDCTEIAAYAAEGSPSQAFNALNEYAGRQLRMQLRMIFRLIDQFMRLRRLDFERPRLEGIVLDLLVLVRESFATAGLCLPNAAVTALDQEQCIHELEELSRSIGLSQPMSPTLLAHALDSVIVNCLVLDSEHRELEKSSLVSVAEQAS
jgi:hypothetical protein